MKLNLVYLGAILSCSLISNAQSSFLKTLHNATSINNLTSSKKIRGGDQLMNVENYATSPTNPNLSLSNVSSYKYNLPKPASTSFEFDMFANEVEGKAEEIKNITGLNSNTDSALVLQTFDGNNRVLVSKRLSLTSGLMLMDSTVYKYTGNNINADSISTFDAAGILLNLLVYNVTNNKVIKFVNFGDDGNGNFTKINEENYTYNINDKISKISSPVDFGGVPANIVQTYTYNSSNNLLDSFGIVADLGLIKLAISGFKFLYNTNNTGAYGRIWSANQAGTGMDLTQSAIIDLNSDKKITRVLSKSNTGVDSLITDESYFTFTTNGNLLSTYDRTYDSTTNTWLPVIDSTYYTYLPYTIPVGIANVAKNITNASCIPNPVNDNAFIHYSSNKVQNAQIILTDVLGKTIVNSAAQLVNGNGLIPIDMRSCSSGLYYCQIKIGGQVQQVIKISKQ
jgi:hypothetical protein